MLGMGWFLSPSFCGVGAGFPPIELELELGSSIASEFEFEFEHEARRCYNLTGGTPRC
jgi:hypothetical protein